MRIKVCVPKRGARFIHATQLDPAWRPKPGQKYKDGPKRVCVVTAVRNGAMYYRGADSSGTQGAWVVPLAEQALVVGTWLD